MVVLLVAILVTSFLCMTEAFISISGTKFFNAVGDQFHIRGILNFVPLT